jgi:sigma-E factor negative regulatory protein RseB
MRTFLLGAMLAVLPLLALASEEDWQWLQRVTDAGRQQPLSGTYLHQMNGVLETFHIIRSGGAGMVIERRVALDGLPREIIRNGDALTCYAPNQKSLLAAKISAMRLFPVVMSDDITDVSRSYNLLRQERDRVAQRDCNWLELKPRDPQRYIERICADLGTALPLKMMTLTPRGDVVEQYTFTKVEFSPPRDKNQFKPQFKLSSQLRNVAQETVLAAEAAESKIEVSGMPAGFRLIRSVQRSLSGTGGKPVHHMVYSDGLVMLSLFVEPEASADAQEAHGMNLHGAINMATMGQGEHLLTVVGDMPESSLVLLIRSLRVTSRP